MIEVSIPGWVVALPLLVYLGVSAYCIFRFVKTDRGRAKWTILVLAGMLFYVLAWEPFRVDAAEPPSTSPPVSVGGGGVPA